MGRLGHIDREHDRAVVVMGREPHHEDEGPGWTVQRFSGSSSSASAGRCAPWLRRRADPPRCAASPLRDRRARPADPHADVHLRSVRVLAYVAASRDAHLLQQVGVRLRVRHAQDGDPGTRADGRAARPAPRPGSRTGTGPWPPVPGGPARAPMSTALRRAAFGTLPAGRADTSPRHRTGSRGKRLLVHHRSPARPAPPAGSDRMSRPPCPRGAGPALGRCRAQRG